MEKGVLIEMGDKAFERIKENMGKAIMKAKSFKELIGIIESLKFALLLAKAQVKIDEEE